MDNFRQSLKLPSIKYGCIDKNNQNIDKNLWAANERNNIIEILKNGDEIDAEKWLKLKEHILDSLKQAIKCEKISFWHELNANLVALIPLCQIISQDKEIVSVMRVVAQRLDESIEWSYSLPGMADNISLFLPTAKRSEPIINHEKVETTVNRSLVRKKGSKVPSTKIMPDDANKWFVDSIVGDLFDPSTLDRHISIKARKIKIKDILFSIGTVGTEIIISESAFKKPFEEMINAMNIDMTRFGYSDISDIDSKLKAVDEFYDIIDDEQIIAVSEPSAEKKGADLLELPKTGQEGVVYMIKCFHLKEMRLAYFNLKAQRIVDYYSLTAVRKFQVEKEHYVFSSVGIIHRRTDGTGVAMSLTDWYKESILYNALKCIPFIKSFLVRKHFQSWFTITVHNRHRRKAKYLENKLLLANVVFGKSMLQILKLLDEVAKITLVPKAFEVTQTELSFLKEFSHVSKSADCYLEKFYKYIKLVVDETAAECYKHFQFCQSQAHNVYLYSDDCIYKKKLKQQERQEALKRSMNQVYQLGDFVRLVNYLLNTTVIEMTLHNIAIFSDLMCSIEADLDTRKMSEREAIFQTNLIIKTVDTKNNLAFSSDVTEIEAIVRGAITGIPQLILRHCYPLDGLLSAEYLSRYKEILFGEIDRNNRVPSILSSKAESRAQMMNDSVISKPELPFIELPSKSDDMLRVATPPKVNPNVLNKSFLTIHGQAIPSKFTPMSTSNIFDILSSNPIYEVLLNSFKDLFKETEEQMELLCKENLWLLDIRAEYDEWSKVDMEVDWKGQSPYVYEQRLGRVKNFLVLLHSVEKTVTIPSRIFVVSLAQILMDLQSEMEFELDSIFNYVLEQVRVLGARFIEDITGVLEILRLRKTDAESFTKVAMYIVECRERSAQYQSSVDYIKSLFDVLKVTDKFLGQSDKDIEDQVSSLWESFLFQLQEANEFVNGEKANVIFAVKSRIQDLENSAKSIAESLNDELYSVLSDDCSTVLNDIGNKLQNVESIKSEADLLIQCYESLQPEPYNRSISMDDIIRSVLFLKSQWNLLNEARQQIETWKRTLFSSFNVPAASDLILEWQRIIVDIRSNEDHKSIIVKEIEEVIGEFASFMSLFSKMSSPLFQLEHWQRFFSDIGHAFIDPFDTLTVGDLIAIDIRQYTSTIDILFSNAVLRNKASSEFEQHLRFWMTREFEFVRHIPDPWFRCKHDETTASFARNLSAVQSPSKSDAELYYENKLLSEKRDRLSRLPITNNRGTEICLVAELTKLNEDITDSLIALPCRVRNTADQYTVLFSALEELRRLCCVIEQCQEKWMFLERIFEDEYFVRSYEESAQRFQQVNKDLLSSLSMVQHNPTAIQHTESGQIFLAVKSVNVKQAELVFRLTDLRNVMADIISSLVTVLDHSRNIFPRLYFLPDTIVARTLNCDISRNIDSYISIVKLCFPSVSDLTWTNNGSVNFMAISGMSGESFDLIKELSANSTAAQSLKEFECVLKSSVKSYVGSYLVQHMTKFDNSIASSDGSPFFVTERSKTTIFDEVERVESLTSRMTKEKQLIAEEIVHDILSHYQSWLLQYPLQTLLITEKIVFFKTLKQSLTSISNDFNDLREKLCQKEKNFVKLNTVANTDRKTRLAVQHLILENRHHIDILDKLIADQGASLDSFSYKSLIKYDVDFDNSRIDKSLGATMLGDVKVEMLCSRFIYEYEYIDMCASNIVYTSVTERSVVNMLMSLSNYEVGTIVADNRSCKETFKEVSQILGRNMFSTICDATMDPMLVQRYMKGALLSGSVLHFDNFEKLQSTIISALSRDIWMIKEELKRATHDHIMAKKIRPLSATSSLIKVEDDEIIKISEKTFPNSSRDSLQKRNSDISLLKSHDLHNLKLNKGRTWPHNPDDAIVLEYFPRVLCQLHLYNSLLDIRYGFGVFSTFVNNLTLQEIPLSMKCQMRSHFLIPIDESIAWKQYLIPAGPDRCQELEACIDLFLKRVTEFLPDIIHSLKRLLPSTISTFNWTNTDCRIKLGKHLYDMIIHKLSPNYDSKEILQEVIMESFGVEDIENDCLTEDSSALIHQLKSQLRVRNFKVSKGFIDKMIELNDTINSNKNIFLVGDTCSGKTVSVDVLSAAINGLYSSAQRILSGSKKRGAIDILKTISQDRKPQLHTEEYNDTGHKRIYLLRVSLSNFTAEEMASVTREQGRPSESDIFRALMTLIKPLLKSAIAGKFEIWLHIDQILDTTSAFIYPLLCLFENEPCVKIIVERNSSPLLPLQSNPDLFGLVHHDCIPDLWKIILKKTTKQFLAQKLITYYGCKVLMETGEILLQSLFDSVSLQLQCSQDQGIHVNCLLQTFCVLEIMLRQYSEYYPHDKEDNLAHIDKKYINLLCFSIVQGARGTLYSVLIGQRLLSLEEFEDKLIRIISEKCEMTLTIAEVNVGIFGLMIDFNSLTMKPYEDVKGCKLPELWSNADGVGKYLLHLMVKENKSVQMNGAKEKIEALLDTVRFNKRLHLTKTTSVREIRQCLSDKSDQYWKIVSNEDPLATRLRENDVIVLERFSGGTVNSEWADSLLPFVLEHKYCFNGEFFEKVRTDEAVIIIANYSSNDKNWNHYSKLTRNLTEINIVDPSFNECRRISYKSFGRWLRKVDRHKEGLSKVMSKRIADFIIDIGLSIRQYRIQEISTKVHAGAQKEADIESVKQLTWSHLSKVIKSIIAVPIDVLQETIKSLETSFPIEKGDFVKKHKKYAIYIRLIRHCIFEMSRAFVDGAKDNDDTANINRFIHESIQRNFSQTISENIDHMILKHFPVPVEKMTDIVMWPCRIIDTNSYENNREDNYQPIVEAHCWEMLNKAQENICNVEVIRDHLSTNPQLMTMSKNYDCLVNIMKMYKHMSNKNCRPSALFVEHSSFLITGNDYGVFLSGLLPALYIRPENILKNDINLLRSAVQKAGKMDQKVVFHVDSSCLRLTGTLADILRSLLNQDSLAPFLQYLQLPFLHQCVRDLHGDFYIPEDSPKEIRLSKAFLENVQRNLKILITCTSRQALDNDNLRQLAIFFRDTNLHYLRAGTYGDNSTEESINFMFGRSSQTVAVTLTRVHNFLGNYFQRFESSFGNAFSTNGAHLKLSSYLYNYLYNIIVKSITEEMELYNSALKSIDYSWKELEVMKNLKNSLQEKLKNLNDKVEISGTEGKNMRDLYANALVQCKNQENKVAELFGPLNEMKEKSKSNFDDISPTYLAALDTIRNLDPDAVEEVKTYVKPPQQVQDLLGIILDLLGYETKWELIKERMVKINLYEELLYLDKDHISDDKFKKLEQRLLDPQLHTENLLSISQAAASLSKWLTAVYRYSSLNREINPQLGQLLSCQDQINRVQTELGRMRVRADLIRQDLEKKIAEHKELLGKRKSVADNLKNVNYKINSGTNLLSDMSRHIDQWKEKEGALNEEMKAVPATVMKTVVRCVYLNKLPHSLRTTVMEPLGDIGLDLKQIQCNRILHEQDYRDILQQNTWASIDREHLTTIVEMTALIHCPGISYPSFGSIIIIHNNNDDRDKVKQMISTVLESETIRSRFGETSSERNVYYENCSKCTIDQIDRRLDTCMHHGHVLVLENVHLLTELSRGLLNLMSNVTDPTVDPRFRLILISNDSYSIDDHCCCGFLCSDRFLHFNFALGRYDLEIHLQTVLIETCESEVSQNILSCNIQRFELEKSSLDEKRILTNIADGCIKEDPRVGSVQSDRLEPVSEGTSILEVEGLHSILLQIDSKLFSFDESRDNIKDKEKGLRARFEKYGPMIDSLSLMLNNFNMFHMDKIMTSVDGSHQRLVAARLSLKKVIDTIKEVGSSAIKSIVMTKGCDPEISETFLEKLQMAIITKLIGEFYVTMESSDVVSCVLGYCIESIIGDCQDLENWSESETGFIRRALICRDTEELLANIEPGLMDHGSISIDPSLSRKTVMLSLILETNIVVLGGLTKSLMTEQELWKEYFEFPFLSCNTMPGFDIAHQPGLLLKTVVWRVLNPGKMEEVKSSIIADVFGEEIFKTKFRRSPEFESMILGGRPSQPIVVSTLEQSMPGIESPLELIHRVCENRRDNIKIRIVDCSSHSEISKVLTHAIDDLGTYVNHLLVEPCWIVLSNLHLCSRDYFSCKEFRLILRNHVMSVTRELHSDSRLFIALELDSSVQFPESFLTVGKIYHCNAESDHDAAVEECVLSSLEKDRSGEIVALIHSGLFSSSQFKYNSMATISDYRQTMKILSQLENDPRSIVQIVDLIYRNKMFREELRQVFDLALSKMSPSIKEYDSHQISRVTLRRNFHNELSADIFRHIEMIVDAKTPTRKNTETYCLVDQRTVEIVKTSVVEIVKQLLSIIEPSIANDVNKTQSHIIRFELIAILREIFLLPIWRMRSISNVRFDETLSEHDIMLMDDEQCLSNDLIPDSWSKYPRNISYGSLTQWINNIKDIEDRCKQFMLDPDIVLGNDLLRTIRETLHPHSL